MELTADIHDKNLVDFEVNMEDSFDNPLVESDRQDIYSDPKIVHVEAETTPDVVTRYPCLEPDNKTKSKSGLKQMGPTR